MKLQSRGEASSDQENDMETDSESDCVVDYTDKSPMDKKEQKQFTKEQIAVYRNNCLEMSQSELDLVILTAIMCSRPPSGENCPSARATTIYLHQGVHNYLHEDILVSSLSFPFSLEQSPDIRTSMESLLTPILNLSITYKSVKVHCMWA